MGRADVGAPPARGLQGAIRTPGTLLAGPGGAPATRSMSVTVLAGGRRLPRAPPAVTGRGERLSPACPPWRETPAALLAQTLPRGSPHQPRLRPVRPRGGDLCPAAPRPLLLGALNRHPEEGPRSRRVAVSGERAGVRAAAILSAGGGVWRCRAWEAWGAGASGAPRLARGHPGLPARVQCSQETGQLTHLGLPAQLGPEAGQLPAAPHRPLFSSPGWGAVCSRGASGRWS